MKKTIFIINKIWWWLLLLASVVFLCVSLKFLVDAQLIVIEAEKSGVEYDVDLVNHSKMLFVIYLLVACYLAFGCVFSSITKKRLEYAHEKKENMLISILDIAFANSVVGILLLLMSDDEYSATSFTLQEESAVKPGEVIVSVKDLEVQFSVRNRILTAIRKISLDIYKGETIAIVGESGSGNQSSPRLLPECLKKTDALAMAKFFTLVLI